MLWQIWLPSIYKLCYERKIFERSWVGIDLSAFRTNLNILKSFLEPQQQFMMIVKADIYGHGAREISKIACGKELAPLLGVAQS